MLWLTCVRLQDICACVGERVFMGQGCERRCSVRKRGIKIRGDIGIIRGEGKLVVFRVLGIGGKAWWGGQKGMCLQMFIVGSFVFR